MVADCRVGGGDCLIKLFGKTIPVPEAADAAKESGSSSISNSTESDAPDAENTHQTASDPSPQPEVVDAEDPKSSSPETPRPSAGNDDVATQREKLKKPDKILPCPRCNSMDTKFCYFNNYNVNQPRHFCKNCQRYWTAGGAMRNVPVGAGRRKNKHAVAASHFLQRVVRAAAAGDPLVKTTNGTVLSFGGHGGHAMQDLTEQVNNLKEKLLIPPRNAAGNNPSSAVGPCSEGSSSTDDKSSSSTVDKPANGVHHHPASVNGATAWPYSCAPSPAYFSSGIAIPIYPAAPGYWGCMVSPGAWSLPWPVQQPLSQGVSSTSAPSVSSSGPESLTLLGKHPREIDEGRSAAHGNNGKVWAPKTIRIDDADEVARSSIWSIIGIKAGDKKQDDADHAAGEQHKHETVFEPKLEAKKTAKPAMIKSSPLLHVNPVALTRSLTFHEGS